MHSAPHTHGGKNIGSLMLEVAAALTPGAFLLIWFFGIGVLFNVLLAVITALAAEALMLFLRGRPLWPFLTDGSALLTGLLLGLALPPLAPWWIAVIGTALAMVIGKHLYGGLGYNPFNPAMVGYVILLISFPAEMIRWMPAAGSGLTGPGAGEILSVIFAGAPVDGMTAATALDTVRTEMSLHRTLEEIASVSPTIGSLGAADWEWINLGFLLGGVWLLYRRCIDWRIPAGLLGSLFVVALLFQLFDGDRYPGPVFHLFSGATMIGAFFIATDPVSASTTHWGRLIYGGGIGVITYIIRTWGGYPDGIAFAVLLMNMAVPIIDYYTRPRAFGEAS